MNKILFSLACIVFLIVVSGVIIQAVTDTTPPTITITSPQNTTYNTRLVDLNYSIDEPPAWVGYSLDGLDNVTTSGEITKFSTDNPVENVTFTLAGSNTSIYIKVPKNATVTSASMNVSGHSIE